ncbi:MAG: exodeoxyribonuclease III [Gammaproteobacteria bacterium RBG_16_57_12]|nr:MAG: exodeoxyribonuclease III [Gammaproteobacteria bacterium RBG_16_57_12]
MKIASWNVNSLKVRLPQVLDWLQQQQPDILALQETKLTDEHFPATEIQAAGYHAVHAGQKTYNGVALLSKQPAQEVLADIPGLEDAQRRILCATLAGIRVINLYVPNGQEVGSEKFRYKLDWLQHITRYIKQQLAAHPKLVVLGDFNVTPEDRDVHDPLAWHEQILCSTPERQALQGMLALGLNDSFRLFEQPDNIFSWWDYRAGGFRRNAGLRIDLILTSAALSSACTSASIDTAPRALERPSDHAPVLAEFTD